MAGMEAQKQIRDNTKEIHEFLRDLQDWEKIVKSKDNQLKTQAKSSQKKELPPIRGKPKPGAPKEVLDKPATNAAKHTYDYFRDKWDKFDVDAALKEVDEDEDKQSEDGTSEYGVAQSGGTPQIFASQHARKLQDNEPLVDAASEKELGNNFFKDKKYVQAIECYSRSLALEPTAVAYANRAMALLKIRRFEDAELDCTEAINLDDRYTKAYARRGTARMERDRLLEAVEDFEFALRLEPQNKELQKQYQEAKQAYEKKNPFRPPEKKMQLEVKSSDIGSPRQVEYQKADEMDVDKKDKVKEIQAAASRAATTAKNAVAQNMVAPKTSYEFETLWRAVADDGVAKARIIKLLAPAAFPRIFKDSLSAVLMVDIIQTLGSFFPDEATFAIEVLENITKVGRFSMTVMFLSQNDKAVLRNLWEKCSASDGLGMKNIEKLESLRSKYKL